MNPANYDEKREAVKRALKIPETTVAELMKLAEAARVVIVAEPND